MQLTWRGAELFDSRSSNDPLVVELRGADFLWNLRATPLLLEGRDQRGHVLTRFDRDQLAPLDRGHSDAL